MVDWVVACFAIALGPQVTYLSGVPGHRTPFTLLIESGYGLETIFGFAVVGLAISVSNIFGNIMSVDAPPLVAGAETDMENS